VWLQSVADFYDNTNQRERRYNQMTAEFERILNIPPTRITGEKVTWDIDYGWTFSIGKLANGLEYTLRNRRR
jgi:hypothetical protein